MKLTDEQAEIMAVCACCQRPLEPSDAKAALEAGKVEPMQMVCFACAESAEHANAAFVSAGIHAAAFALCERVVRAGLGDRYQAEAEEWALRRDNQQN